MDTISKKLAAIEKGISAINGDMATKEDIKSVRGDMKNLESRLKGDINNMATKADLHNMATKADLKTLESRLVEKMDEMEMGIIETVDKHKADKETVNVLEKRVERLEDSAGLPPYAA